MAPTIRTSLFSFVLTKSIHLTYFNNSRILIWHPFTAIESNVTLLSIFPSISNVTCLALSWAGLGSQEDYMDNQLLHGLVPWTRSTWGWQAAACHKEGCGKDSTLPEPCLHGPHHRKLLWKSPGKALTLIISMSLLYLLNHFGQPCIVDCFT